MSLHSRSPTDIFLIISSLTYINNLLLGWFWLSYQLASGQSKKKWLIGS